MRAIALVLGVMLMLYGCLDYFRFEEAGPPQQIHPVEPYSPAPEACVDGTPLNSCSEHEPYYCTSSGEIVPDPVLCGCPDGMRLQGNECTAVCMDGTLPGQCSADQPYYCTEETILVEKATECGCPSGQFREEDKCLEVCSDGTPLGYCSSEQPKFCTADLELVDNPDQCGCPEGMVLLGGRCAPARCIDGTPAGECASTAPNYCNENLEIVSNPGVCGCPAGRIYVPNSTICVDTRSSSYKEDQYFEIATEVSMMVRNPAHVECENAEYISLDLQVKNDGMSPFPITQENVPVLIVYDGSGYKWLAVEYPENDSECSEPARFSWSQPVEPRSSSGGAVWYKLVRWTDGADYYLYYGSKRVKIRPA